MKEKANLLMGGLMRWLVLAMLEQRPWPNRNCSTASSAILQKPVPLQFFRRLNDDGQSAYWLKPPG